MILLNPGPVTLSPRVRAALCGPDLCHREPEFASLQSDIRRRLLQVYGLDPERYAAVLLAGSGTSAMEAMLASVAPQAGRTLIVENGVYGERLARIAAIHGIPHATLALAWGEPIRPDTLAAWLHTHGDITHLAVVHHETTTGRLNPLAEIAAQCRQRGIRLLVDAVSSFGAEMLDFDGWNLDACAATANKCLHGVPGVSFVMLRRDALNADTPPRTLYLDLATYLHEQDRGGTPFTQPVQTFYALSEALAEFEEQGGRSARHVRYAALAARIRRGLIELGIRPLLPDGASSVVLNAYHLPDGIRYETLHDRLKARGFVIYSGQGRYSQSLFRISTMGEITAADADGLLEAFSAIIRGDTQ